MYENDPFYEEHQYVITVLHQLTAGKNPVSVADGLLGHVLQHFIEENQLLKDIAYPARIKHIEDHESIKEQLLVAIPRMVSGTITEEEVDLLRDRLTHHITVADQNVTRYIERYHPHLAGKGHGHNSQD